MTVFVKHKGLLRLNKEQLEVSVVYCVIPVVLSQYIIGVNI